MLTFNVANFSETQSGAAVAAQCVPFGTVKSVKILPPAPHRDYAIAVVEMSSEIEAEKLRVGIGDSKIGSVVIIKLVRARDNPVVAAEVTEASAEAAEPQAPAARG